MLLWGGGGGCRGVPGIHNVIFGVIIGAVPALCPRCTKTPPLPNCSDELLGWDGGQHSNQRGGVLGAWDQDPGHREAVLLKKSVRRTVLPKCGGVDGSVDPTDTLAHCGYVDTYTYIGETIRVYSV